MSQSNRPVYDIDIHQGTTFTRTITMEQPENTPVDITGYTFIADIKKNKTDINSLISFTIALSDPVNGIFTMSLTPVQTAAIDAIIGFYDVLMTDVSGTKNRILEGRATITQQISI